jgi:DNA modification methylase
VTVTVLRGDARNLPLPDESVDLIVTSPPYFGLRSYTDGGEHYAEQIGSEATPKEYVAALLDCTREWVRVLKPTGSLFVNLGDKYSTYTGANWGNGRRLDGFRGTAKVPHGGLVNAPEVYGIPYKSLMGLPWRYALGCIDDLGLTLRAEIIWSKPNGMPESATDRVRRSHEQVFHLVKPVRRYYSAVDELREPHQPQSIARTKRNRFTPDLSQEGVGSPNTLNPSDACNPLGKLPGSVWEIATQPLTVPAELGLDHYAAFPMDLPRRCIAGWSPPGICTACGEGRRPVSQASRREADPFAGRQLAPGNGRGWHGGDPARSSLGVRAHEWSRAITGYACACGTWEERQCTSYTNHASSDQTGDARDGRTTTTTAPPTRQAIVLDPFGGTGTTALVADVLGRHGISVDRSADYCRLARWRTTDPGERARALGVPKPPPVIEGQLDMFGEAS